MAIVRKDIKVPNAILCKITRLPKLTDTVLFFAFLNAQRGYGVLPSHILGNHHDRLYKALDQLKTLQVGGALVFEDIKSIHGRTLAWEFTLHVRSLLAEQGNYTLINWKEYLALPTLPARALYRKLCQFNSTGYAVTSIHAWHAILGVSTSCKRSFYRFKHNVLIPATQAVQDHTSYKKVAWMRNGWKLRARFMKVTRTGNVVNEPATKQGEGATSPPSFKHMLCNCVQRPMNPCMHLLRQRARDSLSKLGVPMYMAARAAIHSDEATLRRVHKIIYQVQLGQVTRGKWVRPIVSKVGYTIYCLRTLMPDLQRSA